MRIIIPTYRRPTTQHTFKALPQKWQSQTTFVADARDKEYLNGYHAGIPVVVPPPDDVKTIAQKRAWILRHCAQEGINKIVMFDDDLRFSVRIDATDTKLRKAEVSDLEKHLDLLDDMLDEFAHVGWSMRQGNNNLSPGWHEHAKMCYVLGYRVDVLVRECELGRIETREDMDYTLQLLKKGFDNRVSADIAVDQFTGFGAKGGCSEERTMERSNADAHKLAGLHPGLVRTTNKEYSASIPRTEVVCSWKKAFEMGLATYGERKP
jgi:hypothetical protein